VTENPLASAYGVLLSQLGDRIANDFGWPSPEAAFAVYVYHRCGERGPVPPAVSLHWPPDSTLQHAPSLAAAGYWLGCGQGDSIRHEWIAGVDRLSSREAFPSDRQSFAYRPLELFGIAVGVATCANQKPQLVAWMKRVLERTRKEHVDDPWAVGLQIASEVVLNGRGSTAPALPEDAHLEDMAVRRWATLHLSGTPATKEDTAAFLTSAALGTLDNLDTARAAVLYQAIREAAMSFIESNIELHWQVGRRRRDAEMLVTTLCRRFHLFAQQLRDRHGGRPTVQIADEYDVQDLMHALLKLHFDDVRAEEVTPSVAGKSGRMDFLLKAEGLAVETKMTRKTLGQKEVGDELIIDMKRYRSHPDYRTLVCLVYDPSGYCHAAAALENDLSSVEGDFRTCVIVCPKGL